ncbi:MAG: DUF2807 domain-containing protein [Flavobacteriales bacterium]
MQSITLDLVASMQINTDPTKPKQLEVITQEGIHDMVTTNYEPDELTIALDGCIKENEEILLDANLDSLYHFKITSAGAMSSYRKLTGHNFRLTNEGLGDLDFALQADDIIAEIKSAGDIILAGAARRLDFLTSGSGDLRAFNFVADTVDLRIIGTSICEVYTDGVLNVHFYKNGTVSYRGNPKQINVIGTGELKKSEI